MATTQPVLAGTTLPYAASADGYGEGYEYRGGMRRMADGSVVVDLVQASGKRRFRLFWPSLTNTQKESIITAFSAIKDTSGSFTAPTGTVYTVTRDPEAPDLQFDAFGVADGSGSHNLRYRCTMYLVEV